jgi:hypothetical protein
MTVYGFDIETTGDNNDFLMGSIVGSNGYCKTFWDKTEMQKHLFYDLTYRHRNTIVTATNLGFDFLALFSDSALLEKFELVFRGSSLIISMHKLKLNGCTKTYTLRFVDTMNYTPSSVKKLGEAVGITKLETPAYIKENRMPKLPEEKQYIEKYNLQDALISMTWLNMFQDQVNCLGARLRMTIAATALDLYRRKYLNINVYHEPDTVEKFIHESYYGGRVECFKRGVWLDVKLNYYDYNSHFPACMINEYPNPSYCRESDHPSIDILNMYHGVSNCTVTAPDAEIMLLPYKDKTGKLLFPSGTFTGTWTHIELRKALEIGYKIIKIHRQIYYTRTWQPFEGYVTELYKLKSTAQDNVSRMTYKLLLNSLYGKWAERYWDRTSVKHINKMTQQDLINASDGSGTISGEWLLTSHHTGKKPMHALPILSSYTTSYARIKLYNKLISCAPIYCDTDSVITQDELETSDKLGELKLEFELKNFICVRPKIYAGVTTDNIEICKLKGLPPAKSWNYHDFNDWLQKPVSVYWKFTKFKESVRRGFNFNQKLTVEKTLGLNDDKRKWQKDNFDTEGWQTSMPLKIESVCIISK